MAQSVEQQIRNLQVGSSILPGSSIEKLAIPKVVAFSIKFQDCRVRDCFRVYLKNKSPVISKDYWAFVFKLKKFALEIEKT